MVFPTLGWLTFFFFIHHIHCVHANRKLQRNHGREALELNETDQFVCDLHVLNRSRVVACNESCFIIIRSLHLCDAQMTNLSACNVSLFVSNISSTPILFLNNR